MLVGGEDFEGVAELGDGLVDQLDITAFGLVVGEAAEGDEHVFEEVLVFAGEEFVGEAADGGGAAAAAFFGGLLLGVIGQGRYSVDKLAVVGRAGTGNLLL